MHISELPNDSVTKLISDDEFRMNLARAINDYCYTIDPEGLGVSTESLSAEIWGHAAGYRIANLLKLDIIPDYTLLEEISEAAGLNYLADKLGLMDVRRDDWERGVWVKLGENENDD